MDKQREKELVDFMENELEQTGDFFAGHMWDGYIEDEDDPLTEEELDYMDENYTVKVKLVPRKIKT